MSLYGTCDSTFRGIYGDERQNKRKKGKKKGKKKTMYRTYIHVYGKKSK